MPAVTTQRDQASGPLNSASTGIAPWTPLQRIAFRFAFVYLVVSVWVWLNEVAVRPTYLIRKPYSAFWRIIVHWTAKHILHIQGTIAPNSFLDTRYLYIELACFLVFSAIATLIWSILDRKHLEYRRLHGWLRILLRYSLIYMLLMYGMDKVIKLQFAFPSPSRLIESYGDSSPMRLMWNFMGYSTLYSTFGGISEVAAAILLLFRRTTTLGALLAFAVMLNVTIMDFSYDVSVKILSLHLVLMAVFLFLPDLKRLLDFFVLNRPTQPVKIQSRSTVPWMRTTLGVAKVLVILYLFVPLTMRNLQAYRKVGPNAPKPPLYGLYEVQDYTENGQTRAPLLTDTSRWRYLIIETGSTLLVKTMDDKLTQYQMKYDPQQRRIDLSLSGDQSAKGIFVMTSEGPDLLQMTGTLGETPISATLHRIDTTKFVLVSRGFHWISESSFSR